MKSIGCPPNCKWCGYLMREVVKGRIMGWTIGWARYGLDQYPPPGVRLK